MSLKNSVETKSRRRFDPVRRFLFFFRNKVQMRRLYSAVFEEDSEAEDVLPFTVLSSLVLSRLEFELSREDSETLPLSVVMPEDGFEVVMSPPSPQPVRKTRPSVSTAARRIETNFFMLICSFCRKIPEISVL